MYTHLQLYMCFHKFRYTHTNTQTHAQTHTHKYTHIRTDTHAHVHTHALTLRCHTGEVTRAQPTRTPYTHAY